MKKPVRKRGAKRKPEALKGPTGKTAVRRPRRQVTATVKLTEDELTLFKGLAKREGMTVSAYFRSAARLYAGCPEALEVDTLHFAEIAQQLRGVATNLNQIARAANIDRVLWSDSERLEVAQLKTLTEKAMGAVAEYRDAARRRHIDIGPRSIAFLAEHGSEETRP